ncbi:MAG: ComF family protein [Burkholderiaceae bacterium]|nr:ComF family protein [Burkholderiaceae bacterium]MDO9089486.1 ComF family protein [Burkholderiaceae bacterium]MDP1969231.1 ComF family protein [Burkholderiaceae bacterium]
MLRHFIARACARLPSRCAVCARWPSEPLCEPCVTRFAQPVPRCQTCALALPQDLPRCGACLTSPGPLDACLAAVSYAYPWSACVSRFKYRAHPAWAGTLAGLMRSMPWVESALEQADWVVPMPLSRERLRERGFNQALELARHLAPTKTRHDLLLRLRHGPPQRGLERSERLRSAQGAFGIATARRSHLQGRSVVLVDDVMTTGASLYAAAEVLRDAGARHITGLVLARTEDLREDAWPEDSE